MRPLDEITRHTNATQGNRVPATTNANSLNEVVKELVSTERSYVKRLRILKTDYADPLRSFARNKDTAIIPPYEAKTLFGNIDHLLPVNEAFLTDLEKMEKMVLKGGPGVGDVALKHFKTLRGFEHYRQYYAKREEAQRIFEHEAKKSSRFSEYIDVSPPMAPVRRSASMMPVASVSNTLRPTCAIRSVCASS